jgi:hypothetical protein
MRAARSNSLPLSRPLRLWPLDLLVVDEDGIHPLLEEGDEVRNRRDERQWLRVVPGDISKETLTDAR